MKKNAQWLIAGMACLVGGAALVAAEAPASLAQGLPMYQRVSGIAGNLNSVGSDTLNNLMAFWVEGFGRQYPNVKIQTEGKGSSTAPPALIAGSSQLGPMSRPMKSSR